MSRKTFDVQMFRSYVNERLLSDKLSDDAKDAFASALEHVLEETGNYKGFRYIYKDDERIFNGRDPNPNWTRSHELNRSYF